MQNESVRCIIWGGNKALRQLYSAQKRSVCGSDQVRSCDGSIPFLLLCCALSKLLIELEEMDVLNPANITSALPVRAEMAQACFCAFKIRWRKKSCECAFFYLPLSVTFIFCFFMKYEIPAVAFGLCGFQVVIRIGLNFFLNSFRGDSFNHIQGDAPYDWETCNKINGI